MLNCLLTLKKKSTLYNKNRIISICFFKLDKAYKDLSVYIEGLKKLIRNRDKYRKSFTIRLYTDSLEIYNIVSKYNIDIYMYSCKDFKENNKHKGLFGTLVRYFPLFGHDVEYKNIIIYSDIDVNRLYSPLIDKFSKYKGFTSLRNSILAVPYGHWINDKNSINAGNCMSVDTILDVNILKKFVYMMNKSDKNIFNVRGFPYGVDEYFLNSFLSKSIAIYYNKLWNIHLFISFLVQVHRWFIIELNNRTKVNIYNSDNMDHTSSLYSYIDLIYKWFYVDTKLSVEAINYYNKLIELWKEQTPDPEYTKYLKYYTYVSICTPEEQVIYTLEWKDAIKMKSIFKNIRNDRVRYPEANEYLENLRRKT